MKKFLVLLLISALLMTSVIGCGSKKEEASQPEQKETQQQETVTLKFACYSPEGHPYVVGRQYFADRAAELSNGTLKIEYYPAGQLGKISDQLKLVENGTVDIAACSIPQFAGVFPISAVTQLPYWTTTEQGFYIGQRVKDEIPEIAAEWKKHNCILLWAQATDAYEIASIKKPYFTPDAAKGVDMVTAGGWFDTMAKMCGIKPQFISPSDYYESAQKGIGGDGHIQLLVTYHNLKIYEFMKYMTWGLSMGSTIIYMPINTNTWEKLSPEHQKVLMQAGQEAGELTVEKWNEKIPVVLEEYKKLGIEVHKTTPEEYEQWHSLLAGVDKLFVDQMKEKGVNNGQEILDKYKQIAKEVCDKYPATIIQNTQL
ncbi:MAG: TRAP transporter substrate-binding protein DctP [Clostridiaceae bacterium]|nr:TRAP transporter substrate-binding protein DctP [Clostridiaceae bacterium]